MANAVIRAELTGVGPPQPAAARSAGGWWSRCAQMSSAYLPVTTEITSLPQLTPEGLPLALARRAAEQKRMLKAVAELEQRGEAVTSHTLAGAAHISREHCVHLAPKARKGRAGHCSAVSSSARESFSQFQ